MRREWGVRGEERMYPSDRELGKRQPERSAMLWPKMFEKQGCPNSCSVKFLFLLPHLTLLTANFQWKAVYHTEVSLFSMVF